MNTPRQTGRQWLFVAGIVGLHKNNACSWWRMRELFLDCLVLFIGLIERGSGLGVDIGRNVVGFLCGQYTRAVLRHVVLDEPRHLGDGSHPCAVIERLGTPEWRIHGMLPAPSSPIANVLEQ